MENTEIPDVKDDGLYNTTIFIVCGFLVGLVITALLFCLMVCKLKLHKVRSRSEKDGTSKVKADTKIQYTRTNIGDSNTNLKRWRSGYGDEEAGLGVENIERNPLSGSDGDISSDGTSGINDATTAVNVTSETMIKH